MLSVYFVQVARGGDPPVTLAEFTLNGGGQQVAVSVCVRVSQCPCVPVSQCPSVPMSQCPYIHVSLSSCVPVSVCPCVPVFQCPSVPVSLYPCVPEFLCFPVSVCPCVPMSQCPSVLLFQDYFDISLVDGFNLPMVISVVTPYPWPQGNEVGNRWE